MNDRNDMLSKFDKLPKSIYNLVKPKMNIDNIKAIALILIILYHYK